MSTSVAVIGAGYVGLVTAACLAELGHVVTAIDRDRALVAALRRGVVGIHEPGLPPLVSKHLATGRLRFSSEIEAVGARTKVIVVAVGTPPGPDGLPDTSAVFAAASEAARLAPRATICIKSTVPPGTSEGVALALQAGGRERPAVAANPEFLREGQAVRDFMEADRVVIGSSDTAAGDAVAGLYSRLPAAVVRCSLVEAELSKYASNALLASRVSFINEVSELADRVGADVTTVARIVGLDRRIGPAFLRAGLGWGGSCFPKDVAGLAALARSLGCSSSMLEASMSANRRQRERAVRIVTDSLAGVVRPAVALLGLAFKPGTSDIRESPALGLATELVARGVEVRATDPLSVDRAVAVAPGPTYVRDPYEAAHGADLLILATDWPEYLSLDWGTVRQRMRGTTVFDARNALDVASIERAGLEYRSLGRDAARSRGERDAMAAAR